jgi:uncharacterized RDD family membrane protein YckC
MSAWVCGQCHSINAARSGRCYSCGVRREKPGEETADSRYLSQVASNAMAVAPPTFLYTGVLLRGVAYLIDVLIIAAVWAIALAVPSFRQLLPAGLGVALVIGTFAYFIVGWADFGTTVGMRLLRLRIVRETDGTDIGYGRAILRLIVFMLVGALLPGFLIALPMVIDRRRRGFHDRAAGTVVIRPANGRLEYPTPRFGFVPASG